MTGNAPSIINNAEADLAWQWIRPRLSGPEADDWRFVSARKRNAFERRMPFPHMGRVRAGIEVRRTLGTRPADFIITHGPHLAFYTASATGKRDGTRHCAISFNFTDLPGPALRRLMIRAFRGIERFAVYSKMEVGLYSRLFEIPEERFDFVRWSVAPPIERPGPRVIAEPYFVALGGEARDYATLAETARSMPSTRFVFVVRPHNLAKLSLPDNVTVHVNLPFNEAWSLVCHAEASLVPLRTASTPNGHVTIVGAMHLGKAQIVTRSSGVTDYVEHEKTALLVPPRDSRAFRLAIERLRDEPAFVERLGTNARAFALANCNEQVMIDYFYRLIRNKNEAPD